MNVRQIKLNEEIGETFKKVFSQDVEGNAKAFRAAINTTININQCSWCDKPDLNFRDALSKKEYEISAMCQTCQDEVFGKEEKGKGK